MSEQARRARHLLRLHDGGAASPGDAGRGAVPHLDVSHELRLINRVYHETLLRKARKTRSAEDAIEAVQELYCVLAQMMDTGEITEVPRDVEGWLFRELDRIVNTTKARERRRRSNVADHARTLNPFAAQHISSPFYSGVRKWMVPGARLERETSEHALAIALGALKPHQRRVLELCYVARLDAARVGEMFGMSAQAVRVAKHRAQERVRKALRSAGYDERRSGRKGGDDV